MGTASKSSDVSALGACSGPQMKKFHTTSDTRFTAYSAYTGDIRSEQSVLRNVINHSCYYGPALLNIDCYECLQSDFIMLGNFECMHRLRCVTFTKPRYPGLRAVLQHGARPNGREDATHPVEVRERRLDQHSKGLQYELTRALAMNWTCCTHHC